MPVATGTMGHENRLFSEQSLAKQSYWENVMKIYQMKRKILLPAAAAMVAIAIFTGGAVMAQENGTGETGVVQSFASRVAAILNLPEADVQSAMEQAQTEMRDEAARSRLDSMVEQGRLTQAQADEYFDWLQSRPEGVPGIEGRGPGFEFRGHGHRRDFGPHDFGPHDFGMKGPQGLFGAPGGGTEPSREGSSGTSFSGTPLPGTLLPGTLLSDTSV
jgi:hypothetical protein